MAKIIDLSKKTGGQEDGKILLFAATATAVEKIRAKNCLLRLGSQNSPIFYNKRPLRDIPTKNLKFEAK